ncbi:uncharacterized protein BKA78DRAFT_297596 [Phyllosticta capitalensis]|uniref:uncharacterized protein n=1 Tax=Phyllosticta capitalensis TaxID=121624 RepID=UPI00312EEBD0
MAGPFTDENTAFQRATKLTQEAFLIFREELNESNNVFSFNDERTECCVENEVGSGPIHANMAADGIHIYGPPMVDLEFDYPEVIKRTVLMIHQCMDVTITMRPMIVKVISLFCTRLEEVHFQPKNEQLFAFYYGERQAGPCSHYVLKATLRDGSQWAIDLTSPQYNWHVDPPTFRWADYERDKVQRIIFCQDQETLADVFNEYVEDFLCDFDDEGRPVCLDNASRNDSLEIYRAVSRWTLRRDFADGIDKFEREVSSFNNILTLPEHMYPPRAAEFLTFIRQWARTVPQRWQEIKERYGPDGHECAVIRHRRLVEEHRPRGIFVHNGVRMDELDAVRNFLDNYGLPTYGRVASEPPALAPPEVASEHFHDANAPSPGRVDPNRPRTASPPIDPAIVAQSAGIPSNPFPINGPTSAFTATALANQQPIHLPTMNDTTRTINATTRAMLEQAARQNAQNISFQNMIDFDGNANRSVAPQSLMVVGSNADIQDSEMEDDDAQSSDHEMQDDDDDDDQSSSDCQVLRLAASLRGGRGKTRAGQW